MPREKKHELDRKENQGTCKIIDQQIYRDRVMLKIFILISSIKLFLIPTYHSTDFEVHRNWLAITHSLPINQWYTCTKSEWTLDYPPIFAWFEYILSQFGKFVDPAMLRVDNLNYASGKTILFQRTTVMISDLILLFGVREIGKVYYTSFNSFATFATLTLCNIGLLMVDHIHFQYNGFLLGILLISIAQVSKTDESRILIGAATFAILLNLKHLYLYVAPAFIFWLLKWYCLKNGNFLKRIIQLGGIVLMILALSFAPFTTQLSQVLTSLFPFKRGLVHAYWAPNAWALYIGTDKVLSVIWKRLGWLSNIKTAAMTGGLVREDTLAVLPTPTPLVTFIATILTILPALLVLFKKNNNILKPHDFIKCLVLCGLDSFIFGWHVHEKAILTVIIPLCILATIDSFDARIFLILSATGHTCILPLLFPKNLTVLKITLQIGYMITASVCLNKICKDPLLKFHEFIYIVLLPFVTIYETILHKLIFGESLPFLPLAFTSIYCAIGVLYSWIIYYYNFCFFQETKEYKIVQKTKKKNKVL